MYAPPPVLKYVITTPICCYNWKPVFAWLPKKTVSGKLIWFKSVYKRKARFCYGLGIFEDIVQYGTSFDMLNNPWIEFEKDLTSTHLFFYAWGTYLEVDYPLEVDHPPKNP